MILYFMGSYKSDIYSFVQEEISFIFNAIWAILLDETFSPLSL